MPKGISGLLCDLGIKKHSGAQVPHRKNTKDLETVDMPLPKQVTIVMQQHIGTPCTPTVKVSDEVYVGTVIGESSSPVAAPIHSSVSGKVSKIDSILMPNGVKVQSVIIDSDGLQTIDPSIKPPKVASREEFVNAVKASGLVGLGGAGFPTYIKLNPSENTLKEMDTLIINGAECEPYITSDLREIIEDSWDILSGVYAVSDLLGVKQAIIGIEDNKPEAIEILKNIAAKDDEHGDTVTVKVLPSRYPQGAEKVLIEQCTGRRVPPGKLPSDVGVVVMNITSIAFLARYLKTGMPLISKRLTVDGSAILEPKNVNVLIGTPIKEVVDFCGGYKETPKKIITGGPMMGVAMYSDEFPILKQNNAILAFNEEEAKLMEPTECIRCGRCVNACPMNLMPAILEKYTEIGNVEGLKKLNLMTCMECGCCAFVCPANRPLVQSFRIGKGILRNAGK